MRPRPVPALVLANLRRHTRDRTGMFFMVIMPFISIIFVGLALGGGSMGDKLRVGVVAPGGDAVTAALLAGLRAHPDLEVTPVAGKAGLESGVREGSLAAGLVITPGSPRLDLVATENNGSGVAARAAIEVAAGRVSGVLAATAAARSAGASEAEADRLVRQARAEIGGVTVVDRDSPGGEPRGFAYTAPANLLLFTFINSMAVAAAMVESRRLGMLQRALTAPVKRGMVLMGEALSRFAVAIAQAVLIVVVSSLAFGVRWGDPLGVAAVVGLFALVATAAAILVGTLLNNPDQAPAIGPSLGVVLGMLGGCLWPREAAGETLNAIGHLFPHAWGLDALLALSRPGTGIAAVLRELLVLAAMAAVLMGTALVLFSRRTRAGT
ncbi:ABC transporter permease [Nonomuraea typhae]|uniref:ABC transporter permease n=1 Tax=Nonomuraea typhae TaxID=2603600 RepID=A0ABW7YUU0_9ACTN